MSDKPILFAGPLVRAILEGRKTQTRRILKPQPDYRGGYGHMDDPEEWGWEDECGAHVSVTEIAPNGFNVCDRLWVRETFAISGIGWGKKPSEAYGGRLHFRADPDHGWKGYWGNWKPSIHMPRWASRLTLIVDDVRVQRLQEISDGDAMAEGCHGGHGSIPGYGYSATPVEHFRSLWNSINGAGAWDANPWVVAVTFRTVHANIDAMEKAA